MASAVQATFKLTGGGRLTGAADLSVPVDKLRLGGSLFDEQVWSFVGGTGATLLNGAAQANLWWHDERTVLTTATDHLDLSALTLPGPAGNQTIAFTKLKFLLVEIDTPDGVKTLRIGPQGATNAAQLWFQAVTANFWDDLTRRFIHEHPFAGWTITGGGARVLGVSNPSASSVTYRILLIGQS